MDNFEYRKINQTEVGEANQLLDLMGLSKWNFKIDPEYCFIAKHDNKIVAVSAGRMSKDKVTGFAGVVTVLSEYQRKGIIKELHLLKIGELKKAGAKKIFADANNPIVRDYLVKDFGFEVISTSQIVKNNEKIEITRLVLRVI
jgi:N-acetylglutamate synthase-like GNAT family acetyltransferase